MLGFGCLGEFALAEWQGNVAPTPPPVFTVVGGGGFIPLPRRHPSVIDAKSKTSQRRQSVNARANVTFGSRQADQTFDGLICEVIADASADVRQLQFAQAYGRLTMRAVAVASQMQQSDMAGAIVSIDAIIKSGPLDEQWPAYDADSVPYISLVS